MSEYTVKAAMPTGKTEKKFGSAEYYVQFEEIEDTAALYFMKPPEVGEKLELEKVKGQWKKVKKEYKPSDKTSATPPATTAKSYPSRSTYKDNSDGQRQGMCINNATAYVNTLEFKKALTDREWAELVHSYATSLYVLGDLKPNEITAETVAGVFGANG